MTESTPTIETRDGVTAPIENTDDIIYRGRISPITITLMLSVIFAGAYAAYQRIGTIANANTVEYTRNLAGGFLAVGMTEDQPGFIVLSSLDQDKVDVSAAQTKNHLAGTHTVVEIQSLPGITRMRLRSPQVILVTEQGAIEKYNVDWTFNEFNILREAADCSHEAAVKKHRCGQPFTDIQETLAGWPGQRVPDRVRNFLVPFIDHRSKH